MTGRTRLIDPCLLSTAVFCGLVTVLGAPLSADTLIIQEDDGNKVTVEARIIASEQGLTILERRDGRWEVIPSERMLDRKPTPGPDPMTPEEMRDLFAERFGADTFRSQIEGPYVVGLVLAAPLEAGQETRAASLLKKATEFCRSVEGVFEGYLKAVKISPRDLQYPLAMLIFETDEAFAAYAEQETGGRGLSAGNIAGFYSGLTNHLVIRMSECHTFETPLHEAIHQQVHNRGILQRLSSAPAWFNEGIATGFEGNGKRINGNPLKLNPRYARMTLQAQTVDWPEVVRDDRAFRGDVLAGEAYAHAWSLHWFLVTKYPQQYSRYLEMLGGKQPLQTDSATQRDQDFAEAFGKPIAELQQEFPQWLKAATKRQKVSLEEKQAVGYTHAIANLGELELTAVQRGDLGGQLVVQGRLRNISPLRPMSFHVTVETDGGTYADWLVPNLATSKIVPLPQQVVRKQMQNGPGIAANRFSVRIQAVVPTSETGEAWQRGELPVPVYSRPR